MTVAELRKALEAFEPELEVYGCDDGLLRDPEPRAAFARPEMSEWDWDFKPLPDSPAGIPLPPQRRVVVL